MKRLFFVISIFLIFVFSVNAYAAVKIDGSDDGIEWQNAEYTLLVNDVGVNNVDFAYAKTLVSSEYEVCYILFLSDRISDSYDNAGFILTVNDSLEIKVTSEGIHVDGDSDEYLVNSMMSVNPEDGVSCEIKVGFKRGLPEKISATACLIDGSGNHSYHYPITAINPFYSEETQTSKSDTTKHYVTDKPTEKKTERVTTTKPNIIPTDKTTAKSKTTKNSADKTVVYFYEKEIIVSQVYESDNGTFETDFVTEEIPTVADVETLSKGLKIQRMICIAGGVVLLGVGAWASLSGKFKNPHDSSESKKKEADKDE